MLNREGNREPTSKEREQIRYLDKLEETMDRELKTDCSRADEWIDRLENELEKPDCCQEARQRISWLMYRLMYGEYE